MDWLWPDFLLLLGCIPLLIALYIAILHRRHRFAIRYSSLSLVGEAIPRSSWLRKHLPFLLFLLALASLVIAMARPLMPEAGLSGQTTIILTLDVSRSMCMRENQAGKRQQEEQERQMFPQPGLLRGCLTDEGKARIPDGEAPPPAENPNISQHRQRDE